MIHGSFLLRGLPNVRAEMNLTVLAYNLKRVLNILGGEKLLEMIVQRYSNTVVLKMWVRTSRKRLCDHGVVDQMSDFSHGLAICWAAAIGV